MIILVRMRFIVYKRIVEERGAVELLGRVFSRNGWSVVHGPRRADRALDLIVSRGRQSYGVDVKWLRQARSRDLEAQLALAVLQARSLTAGEELTPLAIVAVPRLAAKTVDSLFASTAEYLPKTAVGVFALTGELWLRGPGLDERYLPTRIETTGPRSLQKAESTKPLNLFSDRGRWLLKVLLAPHLPPEHLTAPRTVLRSGKDLARAADVSSATAFRFLEALRDEGFLGTSSAQLELVRVNELLERWRAANLQRQVELRARWALPTKTPHKKLAALMAQLARRQVRAAVGLFAACDLLGLGVVKGVPIHLYLERREADIPMVVAAGAGEPTDLVLRMARWPESVFRAAVLRPISDAGEAPVTDLLQTWLDVADHPARGDEQAAVLWKRLQPSLAGPDA
jgi:hypothetical protein